MMSDTSASDINDHVIIGVIAFPNNYNERMVTSDDHHEDADYYTLASGYTTRVSHKTEESSVGPSTVGPANASVPSIKVKVVEESMAEDASHSKPNNNPDPDPPITGFHVASSGRQVPQEKLGQIVDESSIVDEETNDTSTSFCGVSTVLDSDKLLHKANNTEPKIPSLFNGKNSKTYSSPYESAEQKFDQTRRFCENELGRLLDEKGLMDPEVAWAYGNLGKALEEEGRLDEALELYQKRLEIEEQVFAAAERGHPQMGSTYRIIANVLQEQGKFGEALEYLTKALAIHSNANEPENQETGKIHRVMGMVKLRQREVGIAMEQFEKALTIHLKVDGEDHPSVGTVYYSMGNAMYIQGNNEKAMELLQKSLTIYLKAHGVEHPKTAEAYFAIGKVLYQQDKCEEAMQAFQKALAINLKANGPEHPDTGETYDAMGTVLKRQGKYEEAMEQLKKAVLISLKAHGPENPQTGITYHVMGEVSECQSMYEQATEQYQKALEINLKILGPEHATTRATFRALVNVLQTQGLHEVAMEQLQMAHRIAVQTQGADHPDTGRLHMSMGEVYSKMEGKYYEDAMEHFQKALVIDFKADDDGKGDWYTRRRIHKAMANVIQRQGKYYDENTMMRQMQEASTTIHSEALGPEDPKIVGMTYGTMGEILWILGKNEEAVEFFKKSISSFQTVLGPEHSATQSAILKCAVRVEVGRMMPSL